jgi:SAM-dependent methyltransferase
VRFANEFTASKTHPILDAGCGFGRNALALALRGFDVVCADSDPVRLSTLTNLAPSFFAKYGPAHRTPGQISTVCVSLGSSTWPFLENAFSAVTCIHFPKLDLLDCFRFSVVPGGLLFIETFGGQGQNYLDLPRVGQLRKAISKDHDLVFYREKSVGPPDCGAVAVKLLARKR